MTERTRYGIVNLISDIREKANKFIQQDLDEMGHPKLRPAHGTILWQLYSSTEPVTISDVVRQAGRSKSTVSVTLRNLEKHGYITLSPLEGRKIQVSLTAKGENLRDGFFKISEKLNEEIFRNFTEEELSNLVENLVRLDRGLEQSIERRKR